MKLINNSIDYSAAMSIYLSSFPNNERHSENKIFERIHSGKEQLFGYYSDNSELIGIALIWNLEFRNYLVLDYFAITEIFRCRKFGELFLADIIHYCEAMQQTLIIEIENPYNSPDYSIERRRLNFYKKFNCIEFPDFNYSMPALDGSGIIDMKLLSINSNSDNRSIHKELTDITIEIYKQMYYLDSEAAALFNT